MRRDVDSQLVGAAAAAFTAKLKATPASRAAAAATFFESLQTDMVNSLKCHLAAGLSPDLREKKAGSHPALAFAVAWESPRCVRALLDAGANVALADTQERFTALHQACQHGMFDVAKWLVDAGAPLEAVTNKDATPLLTASQNGHADIVRLLLSKNVNLKAGMLDNGTALHLACFNGHAAVCVELLAAGASLTAVNTIGETPLHMTVKLPKGLPALKVLLKHGGSPMNARERNGMNALGMAVAHKQTPCVRLLLPHSDLALASRVGMLPIHACAIYGDAELMTLLLDNGCLPHLDNAGTNGNETPLHLACEAGNAETATVLLKRGAARSPLSAHGVTPLMVAAEHGHQQIIIMLAGRPSKPKLTQEEVNLVDNAGNSAFSNAAKLGDERLCSLLMSHGALITPRAIAMGKLHPGNKALLALLDGRGVAGPGAAPVPGTTCERCGKQESATVRLRSCAACLSARYCGRECQVADYPSHKKACKEEVAYLKTKQTPVITGYVTAPEKLNR